MALRLGCQVDPYLATLPASSFGAVVKRQSDGLWFTGTGFAAPVAASPITVFPLAWDAVPGILTGLVPTTTTVSWPDGWYLISCVLISATRPPGLALPGIWLTTMTNGDDNNVTQTLDITGTLSPSAPPAPTPTPSS